MKQKIQLTIPKPCHENWQNMNQLEKGRFCASCQKTVLDLTHLSDNEIIKLVSKNDNLCGRIKASQLNRNLIETKRTSNYFGYFATSVLAFLGLGANNVVAQEKPVQEQTDNKYQYKPTDTINKITVSGVVTDDIGNPLPAAYIKIKNTNEGTSSDENGKYTISVNLKDTLQFIYLGYDDVEVIVKTNEINVQLTKSYVIEERIVMVGAIRRETLFGRLFRKIGNWFR